MQFDSYKALFFDFDGVVLDSVNIKTDALVTMFEPYGHEIGEAVRAHHLANTGVSRFEKFKHYYKNFLRRELTEAETKRLDQQMSDLVRERILVAAFIPGVREFLEEHSATHRCYVVSATPEPEMQEIVKLRELGRFFKQVRGSPRAKSDHIDEIRQAEKFAETECIMIGDSPSDLNAAKKSRIDFLGIGLEWGGPTVRDFRELL